MGVACQRRRLLYGARKRYLGGSGLILLSPVAGTATPRGIGGLFGNIGNTPPGHSRPCRGIRLRICQCAARQPVISSSVWRFLFIVKFIVSLRQIGGCASLSSLRRVSLKLKRISPKSVLPCFGYTLLRRKYGIGMCFMLL